LARPLLGPLCADRGRDCFLDLDPDFSDGPESGELLVNNFALLAIVSIGMTLVVAAGGVDLSVGTAVDFSTSCLRIPGARRTCRSGCPLLRVLASGLAVGLFNAFLVGRLGITPFLATLGTLFIGHSGQTASDRGGNPVYLPSSVVPHSFAFLGHGAAFGVRSCLSPSPRSALRSRSCSNGRGSEGFIVATGVHRSVAWYSGCRLRASAASFMR